MGRHPNGDPVGALQEQQGNFGGQGHRFHVAAVVGGDLFGDVGVEQRFARKRREARFDVAGRSRRITGEDVAEISLPVEEKAFSGEVDERLIDRRVAMRVEHHRLADDVGHFVEFLVVLLPEDL